MAASKNTVVMKPTGSRGAGPQSGASPARPVYGAIPGSGASDPVGQRPKKTRTVGYGEH
jgi:hypothetical protein